MVLHVEALRWRELLVWRVAPKLTTNEHVQVLRKGLGKAVSQGLDHDVVVLIAISQVLLAKLVLLEASRACKSTHVVLNA